VVNVNKIKAISFIAGDQIKSKPTKLGKLRQGPTESYPHFTLKTGLL
jgi:hypothetical protein